ncbi:hypothetical protein E2562_019330 [Oryza meyeriana var. granulata]|uniref:Uncharacterized protein n=1 Tax=Oryza meyeriana var. granulata TaxID=110450 RepID=A0A6G1C7H5_9ORYZ|nr:hypothetical protein E2562_019330 [Oryza meyeriana var. granulata]
MAQGSVEGLLLMSDRVVDTTVGAGKLVMQLLLAEQKFFQHVFDGASDGDGVIGHSRRRGVVATVTKERGL